MLIHAAVLHEQGVPQPFAESLPFRIQEVNLDPPGRGEVLVKIGAAGLCHSDLSALEGNRKRVLPAVGGHEGAGEVVEVGADVNNLSVGDHVVVLFVSSCGHCRQCLGGNRNLCDSSWSARADGVLPNGARRLSFPDDDSRTLNHWSGASTFAEYAVIHQSSLVRIDTDIPLTTAALLGCAVITGAGSVFNTAAVRPGNSVAVLGLGGVGLSAVMAASLAGANPIIAVDVVDSKLELSKSLGATATFNATAHGLEESISDLTRGGVNYAFEMSGIDSSVALAYGITARGGTIVMSSLPHPAQTFALPLASHVSDEKKFVGSYMGSSWPQRDIPAYVELYRAGQLALDKLRSAAHPLGMINTGFDRLAQGQAVRDVIVFE